MTLEEAGKRTEEARAYLHIDEKTVELANLDSQIANPGFLNDTDNLLSFVSKQASDIRDVIERYESACGLLLRHQTANRALLRKIPSSVRKSKTILSVWGRSSMISRSSLGSMVALTPPMRSFPFILVAVAWKLRIGPRCCIACIRATPILKVGR